MKQVELNGQPINIPDNWEEVPQKQIPELIKTLFMRQENGETYHELLRIVLSYSEAAWKKLMSKYFGKKNTEAQKEQSAMALQELLRMISWMWQTPLTNQPFSSFSHKGIEYVLPTNGFLTMSWGELKDAYIHAEAFTKQLVKGEKHLNLLILTICRPRAKKKPAFDWNGDERVPYNEYIVAAQEQEVSDLDYATKLSVLLFFVGTMKQLLDQYDIFYKSSSSMIPTVETYPGEGFEDNTLLLAEKQLFGNYQETLKVNCHNIFVALERNKKIVEAEMEAHKES